MRTRPAVRVARGPFVLSARMLLLAAGLLSVGLASFNLVHELRSTNVDIIYVAVASLVGLIWLASLYFAWRRFRLAVFLAGLIGFVEFGVIAAGHFVSAPWEIDVYAQHEGLPLAAVLIALLPACALTVMGAIVSWSHPAGRLRQLETLPLLLVSLLGAILAVLHATDNVARKDFGAASPEDGAFAAAVASILWLVGALWLGRARRTGALLIMLGTFILADGFITLHLLGGNSVSVIASKSGVVWAGIALAMATLAVASFVAALTFLVAALAPRSPWAWIRRQSGSRLPSGP
jgi:hypothetical protein